MARVRPLRPGESGRPTSGRRNLAHVARDRGYRWVDRDPVLDEITGLITDSGLSVTAITAKIARDGKGGAHGANGTVNNWLKGRTRRPQNFTVTWVAFALGYERRFVKVGS
jgi:hypothetical protein